MARRKLKEQKQAIRLHSVEESSDKEKLTLSEFENQSESGNSNSLQTNNHQVGSLADGALPKCQIIVNRYEILSQIGEGGMGQVYKVLDHELKQTFALKRMRSEFSSNADSVMRFKTEAKTAMEMTHANFASVYNCGVDEENIPFFVMDYLCGDNLSKLIQQGINYKSAIAMFIQIAEALSHAHLKGVIHRDIKPSNIIIDKSTGIVKIIDFGIAKEFWKEPECTLTLTRTGDIVGSPLYMSPEQCLGDAVDERSDIYAFGCLMYEVLTGKPPFASANPIKTILKQVTEEAPSFNPYALPKGCEEIVLRCLQKQPQDRYQSMEELIADLRLLQDGKASLIRKPRAKLFKSKPKFLPIYILVPLMLSWFITYSISNRTSEPKYFATTQRNNGEDLQDYLKRVPTDSRAWDTFGTSLMRVRDFNASYNAYSQAIHLKPAVIDYRIHLAVSLEGQSRYIEAINEWNQILKKVPDDKFAKLCLVQSLANSGRLKNAKALSQELILNKLTPADRASLFERLAQVHYEQGSYRASANAIRCALQHQQDIQKIQYDWMFLSQALFEFDRNAAYKAALKAVQFDPKNSRSWTYLGYISFNVKDYGCALRAFRKADEIYKDSSYILSWLWRAEKKAGSLESLSSIEGRLKRIDPSGSFRDTVGAPWAAGDEST